MKRQHVQSVMVVFAISALLAIGLTIVFANRQVATASGYYARTFTTWVCDADNLSAFQTASGSGFTVANGSTTIDVQANTTTSLRRNGAVVLQNVDVPQGWTITSASLVVNNATGTWTGIIYGEDEDNAQDFVDNATVNGRTKTTANTGSVQITTTGNSTFDVTSAVQEVIDRVGWTSGNNLGLILWSDSSVNQGASLRSCSFVTMNVQPHIDATVPPTNTPTPTPTNTPTATPTATPTHVTVESDINTSGLLPFLYIFAVVAFVVIGYTFRAGAFLMVAAFFMLLFAIELDKELIYVASAAVIIFLVYASGALTSARKYLGM